MKYTAKLAPWKGIKIIGFNESDGSIVLEGEEKEVITSFGVGVWVTMPFDPDAEKLATSTPKQVAPKREAIEAPGSVRFKVILTNESVGCVSDKLEVIGDFEFDYSVIAASLELEHEYIKVTQDIIDAWETAHCQLDSFECVGFEAWEVIGHLSSSANTRRALIVQLVVDLENAVKKLLERG